MATSKWTTFVHQCLLRRTSGEEFRELADYMAKGTRLRSRSIVQSVLGCRTQFCLSDDPLIPQYIHAIVTLGLVQVSDVLRVLIPAWTEGKKGSAPHFEAKVISPLSLSDSSIVYELANIITTNTSPITMMEARADLMLTSNWLLALASWISQRPVPTSDVSILTLVDAVGTLLVSLASSPQGIRNISGANDSVLRSDLREALSACLPITAGMPVQLHGRLEASQKLLDVTSGPFSTDVLSGTHLDGLQLENSALERPHAQARASLFVYLNAAVCGQNLVQDDALLGFLQNRYNNDSTAMFVDVVVAAFDVVANGRRRNESKDSMRLYRTLLNDKLPLVLSMILETSTQQISAEACLIQALRRVDPNDSPSCSAAAEASLQDSLPTDFRQEFLSACALHRLIAQSSIESISGVPVAQMISTHVLFVKDHLLQQITHSSKRGEQLIGELDVMEGNSGAIVQALVEVMHNLARNKDTVHLKEFCTSFVRRPWSLDVVMMFQSAKFVLAPLCLLLDEWNWDELQGESQPVYDEFGSILLLILTVKHRYNIASTDLGATSPTSFVQRLVEQDASEQRLNDFDEASSKHLGAWISALFVAEELSDAVTSACSPQEFYPLVPSLLSQSLEACQMGMLSLEKLKSGFEYLHASFLLPSLLIALFWLDHHLWAQSGDHQIALQLLQALVKPPASFEAQGIHRTIVAIVAETLRQQLQAFEKLNPGDADLRALITSLKTHAPFCRQISFAREEASSWTSDGQNLLFKIRHAFQALVYWSSGLEVGNTPPPTFTYYQIILGIQLNGASMVLHSLIDELKSMHASPHFELGVDLIATMVCASPTVHQTSNSVPALREILKLEFTSLANASEQDDKLLAEAYAQVQHRVEQLSVIIPRPSVALETNAPVVPDLAFLDIQNINMNAANPTASVDSPALGASEAQPEDIDKMLDAAVAAADDFGTGNIGDSMEDVFGLDSADLGMGNFDDMDLEAMF